MTVPGPVEGARTAYRIVQVPPAAGGRPLPGTLPAGSGPGLTESAGAAREASRNPPAGGPFRRPTASAGVWLPNARRPRPLRVAPAGRPGAASSRNPP